MSVARMLFALALMLSAQAQPAQPVYVVLWFDTEDYITPQDDDACLRLARDLTARGVRATFKIVAEKARVLEQRGRRDVIDALKKHDIAYHSENHSIPPTPAVYLRTLSMSEGAEEFLLREGPGARDVMRIFGVNSLSTYGQPGSSWGPQSHAALRKMGIRTYVDEGRHAGIANQPFWWSGLLWVFNLGPYAQRMPLEADASVEDQARKFAAAAAALQAQGGGVMHFWYHPNEFVTTEFWDGVNFSRGANPPRSEWKPARLRTPEDSERCYRVLNDYVDRIRKMPGVEFKSVAELLPLFTPADPPSLSPEFAKDLLRSGINWHGQWSAAEILAAALGVPGRPIGAPLSRGQTVTASSVARADFEKAKSEAAAHIRETGRLPSLVWNGNVPLSIGDFAAMLARDDGKQPVLFYRPSVLEFERYVGTDAQGNFNWVIHPLGLDGTPLYDLARVEAWTIKSARLAPVATDSPANRKKK